MKSHFIALYVLLGFAILSAIVDFSAHPETIIPSVSIFLAMFIGFKLGRFAGPKV